MLYEVITRDPLEKWLGPIYGLLKNKYYFDEAYDFLFVKPAYWFAETFVYKWMDKGVIDSILRITSYNVCYTKLLRSGFFEPGFARFG